MWIEAGEQKIPCETILEETVNDNGVLMKGTKVVLSEDITKEQIDAMLLNAWNVYGEDGQLLGVHAGFTKVKDRCVTFLKAGEKEELQLQLDKMAKELAMSKQEAQDSAEALKTVEAAMDAVGLTLNGLMAEAAQRAEILENTQEVQPQ